MPRTTRPTRPLATAAATTRALAGTAAADTFRWASTTDPQTMGPQAANVATVTSFLKNICEGLMRRGPDMEIEPSLATAWEPLDDEPAWRFHLREGVRFHGGQDFTADDVLFSYERGISEQSDVRSWFAPVTKVRGGGLNNRLRDRRAQSAFPRVHRQLPDS